MILINGRKGREKGGLAGIQRVWRVDGLEVVVVREETRA